MLKNSKKEKILRKIYNSVYRPGHYYSSVPSPKEIQDRSKTIFRDQTNVQGVDLNPEGALEFLMQAKKYIPEYKFTDSKVDNHRYYHENGFFGAIDGMVLFYILRVFTPKKVIEIGSGFSSALFLDVNDALEASQKFKLTCVEPYPERLNSLLLGSDKEEVRIIQNTVQDVPIENFTELQKNDILFIDSSHVSKIGSDVNFLFFEILPKLNSGVIIHIHDIHFPFEYPKEFIDYGIYWNEAYLVRAFLMFNPDFEIIYFSNYMGKAKMKEMCEIDSNYSNLGEGASLWIRKK